MSNVPLMARTRPAASRLPKAASAAAPNVRKVPATVTWFGVMGSRPMSRASRCAFRLTHAWKRVVNTRLHLLSPLLPGLPGLPVDLEDPGRDDGPCIALGLGQAGRAQPAPQQV